MFCLVFFPVSNHQSVIYSRAATFSQVLTVTKHFPLTRPRKVIFKKNWSVVDTHIHKCTQVYNEIFWNFFLKAAGSNTNSRLFLPLNCECEGVTRVNVHVFLMFCFVKYVQRASLKNNWSTIFSARDEMEKKMYIYEWILLRSHSFSLSSPPIFTSCLGVKMTQPTCTSTKGVSALSGHFDSGGSCWSWSDHESWSWNW